MMASHKYQPISEFGSDNLALNSPNSSKRHRIIGIQHLINLSCLTLGFIIGYLISNWPYGAVTSYPHLVPCRRSIEAQTSQLT